MPKINLNFQGKNYSIDKSLLTGAIADLEAAFSNLSGGSTEERLEGDGAEYYTLAPAALSFRSTAPLNELQEIQINGITVDPSNYTLEEGSTIVTFPIEYLKTLNVGSYEVAIASDSKTVKGRFTVAAPKLNEHGFYYNQPYTAYVPMFGENESVFIREYGTMDIIGTPSGSVSEATYSVSGNTITVVSPIAGTLTGTVSEGEIFINELATNFVLASDDRITADEDYVYIYKEDLGGYEVTAIDKTKAKYGAIKTGINGIDTVKLADKIFYNNENIAIAPDIPNSVTTIGDRAFYACCALTSINIPNGVIGTDAFGYCDTLTNVILGNGVTTIEDKAFYSCEALTSINIPDSVTTIGGNTFSYCKALTNVTLGNGVTTIGNEAFRGCEALTNVTLGNSVTTIEDKAFYSCKALTSINIPNGVTIIGNEAFFYCEALTSINIPDSVIIIEDDAFYRCKALTNVTLGTSVTTIGDRAFYFCEALTSINIPNSVTTIGESAFGICDALTSVTLGNSITTIGNRAFYACRDLTSIVFEGTIAQWNAIEKGEHWNSDGDYSINIPATYVQCSDGQVVL